jgi:hypothetical protein
MALLRKLLSIIYEFQVHKFNNNRKSKFLKDSVFAKLAAHTK